MSLKDILALVLSAEEDESALKAGEVLAQTHNASLAATFMTALPDEPLAYEPTVVAGIWAELLSRARGESEAERLKVENRLARFARPCQLRVAEALSRDLGRVGAVHARYADLAIVRRPEGDGDPRHDLIEGVLYHAGRPALVVPPGWAGDSIGKRAMVAWDASREATRALADAQSLLAGADMVTVATVDAKPKAFGHGENPGADIAAHLTRRGLTVQIHNLDSMGRSVSDTLCAEVDALQADVMVMGGYAHARLREMLFGGATRDLLSEARVPLLMAH